MHHYAATLNLSRVALWLLLGVAGSAWTFDGRTASSSPLPGGDASHSAHSTPLDFDIPAQPLAEALRRYAALTRQATLVPGELVSGVTSSAVRGVYASDMALQLLLQGTGLQAEPIPGSPGGGFVLKKAVAPVAAPHAASLGDLAGYPGLVQTRVWKALCDDPRTRPGVYRSLLRFQIDAAGQLQRVRLLSSTGNDSRDAAVRSNLQAVHLHRPPPPHLPQPLTLLIEPDEAGGRQQCATGTS